MSNNKDFMAIPAALSSIIEIDNKALALTDDDAIKNHIKSIQFFIKRTFNDTINIGYHLVCLKSKCAHGDHLEQLKKLGFCYRNAHYYSKIYLAFRELDSKKAIAAFKDIELSKLKELTKLSKQNLGQLAKSPDLINEICQKTTSEFKQQILPGLISGVSDLSILQRELTATKKNLQISDRQNNEMRLEIQEQSQLLNQETPRFISNIKIQARANASAIVHEIKRLSDHAITITEGRHANDFQLSSEADRIAVQVELSNSAIAILAQASELSNYIKQNLSPPAASVDAMNAKEIAEAQSNFNEKILKIEVLR